MGSLIFILIILVIVILVILFFVSFNAAFFGGIISAAREPKNQTKGEYAALEERYKANETESAKVWARRFRGKTDEEIAAMIKDKKEGDQHVRTMLDSEFIGDIPNSRRLEYAAQDASMERIFKMALEIIRAEREASSKVTE